MAPNCTGGAATARRQSRPQVREWSTSDGDQREQQSASQSNGCGKEQDMCIQAEALQVRHGVEHVERNELSQELDGAISGSDTQQSSGQS